MPLWLAGEPLVLASKSAIRHALLRDAGVPVEVQPADIDERTIEQQNPARAAGAGEGANDCRSPSRPAGIGRRPNLGVWRAAVCQTRRPRWRTRAARGVARPNA